MLPEPFDKLLKFIQDIKVFKHASVRKIKLQFNIVLCDNFSDTLHERILQKRSSVK